MAAFRGTALDATAAFREGRISDPNDTLQNFIRTYSTTNRPDRGDDGCPRSRDRFLRAIPGARFTASYALGSAQVVQSGFDPTTGLLVGPLGRGHRDHHLG